MLVVIRQKALLPLGDIEETNNKAVINIRYNVVGTTNSNKDSMYYWGCWQGCRIANRNTDHYDM